MKRVLTILLIIMMLPVAALCEGFGPRQFVYKLHGQTRRDTMEFTPTQDGGMTVSWGIERNLKWQSGTFTMTPEAVKRGSELSTLMPIDGDNVTLPATDTYNMLSAKAFQELKSDGRFHYNGVEYVKQESADGQIHVAETVDGSEMWILDNEKFPIVMRMKGNPLGQNWTVGS